MNSLPDRHRRWIAIVNSRDLEGYVDLVTDDIVWIPPVGAAVVGRQGFRDWLKPFFSSYSYEYTSSDERYLDAGEWVVEYANFETRMTPLSGGGPMSHRGSYTAIWRRDSSTWRIERYIDVGTLLRPD